MADTLRPFDPKKDKPRSNPDGTSSTELSRTVWTSSGWANVPSLWWTDSGPLDLGHLSDDQLAFMSERYEREAGKLFPRFVSISEAESAASARSKAGGANALTNTGGTNHLRFLGFR